MITGQRSSADLRLLGYGLFGQPGAAGNTCHKHLSRARRDVQALLQDVVNRDELLT